MKIVSYNINGIRASAKNGIIDWIKDFNADVYCFQEVRASENVAQKIFFGENKQMDMFSSEHDSTLKNYFAYFNCGEIAGYAGTVTLCKTMPDEVFYDMGKFWKDNEGRTTTLIFGKLAIVNAYIPNGNSRLEFKMQYLDALNKFLSHLKQSYFVICVGDFNIAHNEIDLTNPKECKNKSVFLPIERQSFQDLLDVGFVDVFRFLNPQKVDYSWRSYRSRQDSSYNSWKYRIDYILVTNNLQEKINSCEILDLVYSDHLPVVADID